VVWCRKYKAVYVAVKYNSSRSQGDTKLRYNMC